MRRHTIVGGVGALFLAVALAACGSGDATPTSTTEAEPTPTASTVATSIENLSLQDLSVEVGTTVIWTNRDGLSHTTTSGAPLNSTGLWDRELPDGEVFSFTFTEPGEYPYYCRIHPYMMATITVTDGGGQATSPVTPTPTSGNSGFSY